MMDGPGAHEPIVVMGGGPAGVFTACGLRDLGHEVVIITRPRPYPAWEGVSTRVRNSLQHFGFSETVASLGPLVTRAASWNGHHQSQNREYIVNRQTFDQALLRDAVRKQVRVMDARIDRVSRKAEGWTLRCHTAAGPQEMTTGFLVEARGRESRISRRGASDAGDSANVITAPATSALLKSYRVPRSLPPVTAVASFARGWAWHLRDGQGAAILQLFISSTQGELPPRAGQEPYFATLLATLPEAGAWLAQAETLPGVSVRSAAARKSAPAGGADFLVVGDGAMALDPLSGNGIFYALGSGLAAAPVINSLLREPENRALALQFFQERLDFAFRDGCRMAREFYAAEQRWPTAAFWKTRAAWPPGAGASHPDPQEGPVEICEKPVVIQGVIRSEKVMVTLDYPRGVWQIEGIPLVPLLERLRAGHWDDAENAARLGGAPAQVRQARLWLCRRMSDLSPP